MRFLIIGDVNHIFNKGFLQALKKQIPSVELFSLSTNQPASCSNENLENSFHSLPKMASVKFGIIRLSIRILYSSFCLLKLSSFGFSKLDRIIIQGGMLWLVHLKLFFRLGTQRTLVALWGSDFYKCKNKSKLHRLLSIADVITVGCEQMKIDVVTSFPDLSSKVHVCYFGVTNSQELKLNNTIDQNPYEGCIVIGNNGSENNQHLEVLQKLNEHAGDSIRSQSYVLPLTYGLNQSHRFNLLEFNKTSTLDIQYITDFMAPSANAALKQKAKLYIHLPVNDAFSASMREFLYLNKPVITGDWLPYNELKNKGFNIHFISNMEQLPKMITEVLEKQNTTTYKSLDERFIDWDVSIIDWIKHLKLA